VLDDCLTGNLVKRRWEIFEVFRKTILEVEGLKTKCRRGRCTCKQNILRILDERRKKKGRGGGLRGKAFAERGAYETEAF